MEKWRDRFVNEGLKGLDDRSRRPHVSPNKTSQLVALGIPLEEITIQTDNGTEFTRNGKDLTKKSLFEKTIDDTGAIHARIPVGVKKLSE